METIQISDMTREKYEIAKSPKGFDEFSNLHKDFTREQILGFYFMRTRLCKVFMQRVEDAREVIDLIAEEMDLTDSGRYLYAPIDGETPIVEKIRQYLDRGGDKVKLKKRVDELEKENSILRGLLGK